jgi:hypothetical protein
MPYAAVRLLGVSSPHVCRYQFQEALGVSGIDPGRDGVYAITVAVEYTEQIDSVRSHARSDAPERIARYEE